MTQKRVSRKRIDDMVQAINRASGKTVVSVFWKDAGLKSDLKVNEIWNRDLTNKQMEQKLFEIMRALTAQTATNN